MFSIESVCCFEAYWTAYEQDVKNIGNYCRTACFVTQLLGAQILYVVAVDFTGEEVLADDLANFAGKGCELDLWTRVTSKGARASSVIRGCLRHVSIHAVCKVCGGTAIGGVKARTEVTPTHVDWT